MPLMSKLTGLVAGLLVLSVLGAVAATALLDLDNAITAQIVPAMWLVVFGLLAILIAAALERRRQ